MTPGCSEVFGQWSGRICKSERRRWMDTITWRENPVPSRFEDDSEYTKTFYPLMLQNLWATVFKDNFKNKKSQQTILTCIKSPTASTKGDLLKDGKVVSSAKPFQIVWKKFQDFVAKKVFTGCLEWETTHVFINSIGNLFVFHLLYLVRPTCFTFLDNITVRLLFFIVVLIKNKKNARVCTHTMSLIEKYITEIIKAMNPQLIQIQLKIHFIFIILLQKIKLDFICFIFRNILIFTGGKSINKICLLQKLMSCSKWISSILSQSSIFNKENIFIFIDKSFWMSEMTFWTDFFQQMKHLQISQ